MIERRRRPFLIRTLREAYYTIANPLKFLYWRIAKPVTNGAKALVLHEEKFLLVRIGYAHRKWTLPGGKVDPGENYKQAAIRELHEEAGIVVPDMAYLGTYSSTKGGKRDTVECYTARSDSSSIVIDDQEIVDAGWFSRDELPEDRISRIDEILVMYDTYKAASSLT